MWNRVGMNEPASLCPTCQMPRQSATGGLVTQFLSICRCSLNADEQQTPMPLCTTCGKHTEQGRDGSLTQFLFRSDLCQCQKPRVANASSISDKSNFRQAAFTGFIESDADEPELEIVQANFPRTGISLFPSWERERQDPFTSASTNISRSEWQSKYSIN